MKNDFGDGRCVDWLANDHWRQFGHFDWDQRVAPGKWSSPEEILSMVKGDAAYLYFEDDPLAGDRILELDRDFHRLNMKLTDWTTARCFWPKPGDIKVPYRWLFFGTKADILMLQMVLQP